MKSGNQIAVINYTGEKITQRIYFFVILDNVNRLLFNSNAKKYEKNFFDAGFIFAARIFFVSAKD